MQRFYRTLDEVCTDEKTTMAIVKTAQVVARLYRLQLEELNHDVE
jgi:3-oxoacyl-[acyl-carrier-protein] synthase-3